MNKKAQTQLLPYFKMRRKRNRYHPDIKKEFVKENPTTILKIEYNENEFKEYSFQDIQKVLVPPREGYMTWINIIGFEKRDIDLIGDYFKIHYL